MKNWEESLLDLGKKYKGFVGMFLLCLTTMFSGCGRGSPADPPSSSVTAPNVITAADVFTNSTKTWIFQNGFGDTTTIEVLPQSAGTTTWHYTKSNDRAYWAPGQPSELWWYLEKTPDGAWFATGGHVIFPLANVDSFYTLGDNNGRPRPALIIPAKTVTSLISYQTTFWTSSDPNTLWRTDSYEEWISTPVYSGWSMVSEQWEGKCTHEKWWFAPGFGMVKVAPLAQGDTVCQDLDPKLTMVRVR